MAPPFRFEQPNSRPYSVAIADLLRTQYDPQAQAAAQKGAIYGSALQQIGQSIGQIPQQIQQQKQQAADDALRAAQTTKLTNDAAAGEAEAVLNQQVGALLDRAKKVDGATGLTHWDRGIVQEGLAELGAADRWKDYEPLLDAGDKDLAAMHSASQSALKHSAKLVAATNYNAAFFDQELTRAVENRQILPADADQIRDAVKADPGRLKQIINEYAGIAPPADYSLGRGQTRISGETHEVLAEGEPIPATIPAAPNVGSFEDYVTRTYGENPTPQQIIKARAAYAVSDNVPRAGTASGAVDAAMPSDFKTAFERAILSIPAVRRGGQIALANRLWQEGKTDELKDVIRQAATEGENVDAKNQIRGRLATVAALQDTKQMIQDLQAKGVPTGWLTGTVEDLARKLGTTTNPEYVVLSNRLMDTLINYRRSATGVQFGLKESAEYQRMFPNYRQELPVNLGAIEGLLRAVATNDRIYWENKLGKEGAALIGAIPGASGATGRRFNATTGKLE